MELVEANGIRMAVDRSGSGPALLLMHGNEADHTMFDALACELRTRFTVVTYDQRDCGATENGTAPYGLADLGDDVASLMAAIGLEKAHVYGSSLGGLVAQSVAARHPGRVDRLVLGNTWRAGVPMSEVNPEGVRAMAELRGDRAANAAGIAAFFFPQACLAARPSLVDMFRGSHKPQDRRERRSRILSDPAPADLSAFPRPVLLITGAQDRVIPPAATEALARWIPDARLERLEDVGHVPAIQVPGRLASLLGGFLLQPTRPRPGPRPH